MDRNKRDELIIITVYLAGIAVFYFLSSAPLWIFIAWAILACIAYLCGHRTLHTGVNTMLIPTLVILAILALVAITRYKDLNLP